MYSVSKPVKIFEPVIKCFSIMLRKVNYYDHKEIEIRNINKYLKNKEHLYSGRNSRFIRKFLEIWFFIILHCFQRLEANTINREVFLFYRHESEKWCIGPSPTGSYCWIYCDSQSRLPTARANQPFWFEHVGGSEWKNAKIIVNQFKPEIQEK